MGRITLEQAAAWCGGQINPKYKDVVFFGANNDTRKLKPDQLFVALKDVRDGHDIIPQAMEKGAAAVLCSHCEIDCPAIIVSDPRTALGDIARMERKTRGYKVVGVTGSVGKSTTKEMIYGILQTTFRTGKTPANHNNDIGLPMAILGLRHDTEVAVLEMGMNHFREMAYLSSIAQPDVAVIVNIGTMHIENLGSQEGILQAKMEILEAMDNKAPVIINGDDPLLWGARHEGRPFISFASHNDAANVRAEHVDLHAGGIGFDVRTNGGSFHVDLPVEGEHYVCDALAAITVGLQMGVNVLHIQDALVEFQNMEGRQEILQEKGYTIIKDCYNAGPESMAAALKVLGNQPGRKIAVLGDMLELGVRTQAEHYRVGRFAAEVADLLLVYGPNGGRVLSGALTGGLTSARAKAFETQEEMVKVLKRVAKPGDVMLFKGSHGMHMENVLEKFLAEEK